VCCAKRVVRSVLREACCTQCAGHRHTVTLTNGCSAFTVSKRSRDATVISTEPNLSLSFQCALLVICPGHYLSVGQNLIILIPAELALMPEAKRFLHFFLLRFSWKKRRSSHKERRTCRGGWKSTPHNFAWWTNNANWSIRWWKSNRNKLRYCCFHSYFKAATIERSD